MQRGLPKTIQTKSNNPLLDPKPPVPVDASGRVWWATIHRAALDVVLGREPEYTDAIEFFRSTGLWLCSAVFGMEMSDARGYLARLLRED